MRVPSWFWYPFFARSNTVRVGVDDLIKQNGCLCCCVVILWKFTGKGESVVPQGKEKFPFQRIIRLKRNKFERKQEGVVVDIPGCRSHQMKLPRSNKIDRTVLSSIFFPVNQEV